MIRTYYLHRILVFLGLSGAILGVPRVVPGQLSEIPVDPQWAQAAQIVTMAESDDTLYVGGYFSTIARYAGNAFLADPETGEILPWFPEFDGGVYDMVADGEGGWFVAGDFDHVDGAAQAYLAHISPDYTLDTSWTPEPDARVLHLLHSGGTLYVSGDFTTISGTLRSGLAAIDAASGDLDTAWDPNPNYDVLDMALSGSTLYLGGTFNQIGGETRDHLAAVDASTGAILPWNPGANNIVQSLAIDGTALYVGGYFSQIAGQSRAALASIDLSTAEATSWDPGANGTISDLQIIDSKLYVCGAFISVSGESRSGLASFELSTGDLTSWAPDVGGSVYSIAALGTSIFITGSFEFVNGQDHVSIAAFDRGTGQLRSWEIQCMGGSGGAKFVAASDSLISFGGLIEGVGDVQRSTLAAIDLTTGDIRPWNPSLIGSIHDMDIKGTTLYVAGDFLAINGEKRDHVAAFDTTTGDLLPWAPVLNNGVRAIVAADSSVFIGGNFDTINTLTRVRLAEIDFSGNVTSWDVGANAQVRDFEYDGTNLYVMGSFEELGGESRNCLGVVSAATGAVGSLNLGPDNVNSSLNDIQLAGTTLYVGGDFSSFGGELRGNLAAIDTQTSSLAAWNPWADDEVGALAVDGSSIYVGGGFSTIGGTGRRGIAEIDATTGALNSWNPGIEGGVFELLFESGRLHCGGTIVSAGGLPRGWVTTFTAADTTAPVATISALESPQTGPEVLIPFEVSDGLEGTGASSVRLWVQTPGRRSFVDTGLVGEDSMGVFLYQVTDGEGLYEFAATATDHAGNSEVAPIAGEASVLISATAGVEFWRVVE
ncbi:PQQ-like beta-propeller repeat protein [bacterium]|nr:PQQ-like beta-propeller repeat protein [bacterium]